MAEALLDAVFKATNQGDAVYVSGDMLVAKMMGLPDTYDGVPYSAFLNDFGRGNRDDVPRTNEGSVTQTLRMLNDPVITQRIKATAPDSTLQKLLASTKDPGEIADTLYLTFLSRYQSGPERDAAIAYLADGDLAANSEDLQYALINRLTFLFN